MGIFRRTNRLCALLAAAWCTLLTTTGAAVPATADEKQVDHLVGRLISGSGQEKVDAAAALVELNDPASFQGLTAALKGENPLTRIHAAWALGAMNDPRCIEALAQALGDSNSAVAKEAVLSLQKFGARAEPTLLRVLGNSNPKVGWRAAGLLALLGNPAGRASLLGQIRDGSPGEAMEAAKSLSLLKDRAALEPLVNGLLSDDKDVPKKAAKVLSTWLLVEPTLSGELLDILQRRPEAKIKVALLGMLGDDPAPRVTAAVVALARHPEGAVRAAAVELLAGRGPEQIPLLLEALRDREPSVRLSAAVALGETADPRAIAPIVALLRDPALPDTVLVATLERFGSAVLPEIPPLLADREPRLRAAGAKLLGLAGGAEAFGRLEKLLADGDEEVRAATVEALGRSGGQEAVSLLITLLGGQDRALAEAASAALAEAGPGAVEPLVRALAAGRPGVEPERLAEIFAGLGAPAAPQLTEIYRKGPDAARLPALAALGRIGGDDSFAVLSGATGPGNSARIRAEAARQLANFGEGAGAPLLRALADEDAEVRRAAVDALAATQAPGASEALLGRYPRESTPVKAAILAALLHFPSPAATKTLLAALGEREAAVRLAAVETIGETAEGSAPPALLGLLSDPDASVRQAAVSALGRIGDSLAQGQLIVLLAAPDPALRRAAVEALGNAGDEAAISPLVRLLKDADEDLRGAAFLALSALLQRLHPDAVPTLSADEIGVLLGFMGSPDSVSATTVTTVLGLLGPQAGPALARLATEGDFNVRVSALSVLGRARDRRTVPDLLGILEKERDPRVQQIVIRSLGQIGDPQAADPIAKLLSSPEWGVRREAVIALGYLQDSRQVSGVMRLLTDTDARVREAARKALFLLTGDKCPLLAFIAPFPYAERVFFGLMVLLLALPLARRLLPPLDGALTALVARLSPGPRAQWWVASTLGVIGLGLFAYSLYCQLTALGTEPSQKDFFVNLYLFSLKTYPFFVGGCLLSGVIMKHFSTKWRLPQSMAGACTLGAVLPLCSCGAVPLTRAMMSLDIPRRTVIAFLVVTPVLNPFVIVLSYGVIGWEYTALRVFGTFLVAVVMGYLVEWFVRPEEVDAGGRVCGFCKSCVSKDAGSSDSGLVNGLHLMVMLHRYIIVGVMLGAALAAYLPMYVVTKYLTGNLFGLLLAVTVGVPLYLCTGEEVLFLKPLLDLGLPMGHAVAFTIAANGICVSSIAVLFGVIGRRTTIALMGLFWLLPFFLGFAINKAWP